MSENYIKETPTHNETENGDKESQEASDEKGKKEALYQRVKTKLIQNQEDEVLDEADEELLERIIQSNEFLKEIKAMKVLMKGRITHKDRAFMKPNDALELDNRGFTKFFKAVLFSYHPVLSVIFVKSVMKPTTLRLLQLLFHISLTFSLNAMFYSDDYIQQTADEAINGSMVKYLNKNTKDFNSC